MFSNSSKVIFAIFLREKASRSPGILTTSMRPWSALNMTWAPGFSPASSLTCLGGNSSPFCPTRPFDCFIFATCPLVLDPEGLISRGRLVLGVCRRRLCIVGGCLFQAGREVAWRVVCLACLDWLGHVLRRVLYA